MVESANVDWVDCSGSVGGSMGTDWVLLHQIERGRRAFKIYATKYLLLPCKYSTWGRLAICFEGICNTQTFTCTLDRLWGAIGVFEMFIYRLGGANHFFISWGMHELFKQNVLWLSFDRDCIAAVWRCAIAATLVSNRQQLQMKLGRYC